MKLNYKQLLLLTRKVVAIFLIAILELAYFPVDQVLAQVATPSAEEQKEASMAAVIQKLTPESTSLDSLEGLSVKKALPTIPSMFLLPRHRGISPVLGIQSHSQSSAGIAQAVAVQKLDKKHYRSDEDIAISVANTKNQNIEVTVLNPDGYEADVDISREENMDSSVYVVTPRIKHFKPGRYTLTITDAHGKTSTQDFTWGVLAINTNKSMYTPQEEVKMAIAVLNDSGDMVCDARVTLDVTGPNNLAARLSTDDKTITVNPECTTHEVTLKPDYEASILTEGVGHYALTLSAETKNGKYTITDGFNVKESVAFDVERISATRIYPPNVYPVVLEVTANQDFSGTVSEIVPGNFEVSYEKGLARHDSITRVAASGSEKKAVLGVTVPGLGMPFKDNFEVSLGFGDHMEDQKQQDFYAQFGVVGHDGIDFDMPVGTPILSVDDGEVVLAEDSDYGNTVVIKHTWGKSYYGHLSSMNVASGDKVKRGDEIARSGNTGITTGSHLHFGIKPETHDKQNGYFGKMDPSYYLGLRPKLSSVLGVSDVIKEESGASVPSFSQAESDNMQLLTWQVDIKKGDKIKLGYSYKAPQVSPQFYTIGPATFVNKDNEKVFQEERLWQIAADALSGRTVLYFHGEASDFNSASGAAVMTRPEANTATANTEAIGVRFTGYPCQATNVAESTTEVAIDVDSTMQAGEVCIKSFYSSPVGQAITINQGDTLIATTSASTEGTEDVAQNIYFLRYVAADGTYEQFGKLTTTTITTATAMASYTVTGAANATRTFAADDRIVIILVANIIALDGGGGHDEYRVDFDMTSFPSGVTIYNTVITPSKPSLAGTADDDFNPTIGSAGQVVKDQRVVNSSKWYHGTSVGSYTFGETGFQNASGSAQWLRLENVNGNNAFTSGTYVYQPTDTNASGSGTITTVVNSSMALTNNSAAGLLLWTSDSDYIKVQAYSDGTLRRVAINDDGVLSGATTITPYNRVWLRWTKSSTNYTASYSTDGTTFNTIGSPIAHATTFTRVGLFAMSGSATTNYSAGFEYFKYNLGTATYTQGRYRWYENADAIQPTTALKGFLENETTTLSNTSPIRLRMSQTVAGFDVSASSQQYKLQYATDTQGTWTDVGVTGSEPWCNDSTGVTCNTSWGSRFKITFDNSDSAENLVDFPALVKLSSASGNINFDKTKFSGEDIRFVDPSDETVAIPHEIEKWDEPGGEAVVWVKVPQIDAGSTTDYIYMYYDNASASSPATQLGNNTHATGVWDSTFTLVHHLSESGSPYEDATANNKDGAEGTVAPTAATGQIGGTQDFNGTDDKYEIASPNLPHFDFTIAAWVNLDANTDERIFHASGGSSTTNELSISIGDCGAGLLCVVLNNNAGYTAQSTGTISNTTWTYVTVTRSGSTVQTYLQGAANGSAGTDGNELNLGACQAMVGVDVDQNCNELLSNFMDGRIDELRVSSDNRSADWIEAEYLTMTNAMNTYAGEETLWCNDSSGVTCDTNWSNRVKITFNNSASTENLVDFPVLVKLNSGRIDYSKTQASGQDLRFVDPSDRTVVIPHEIEEFNETGDDYVWVKVPQINAGSTTDYIWMYYGNAGASPPDAAHAISTWNSSHKAVWHLNETVTDEQTSGTHQDATTNNNDGTQSGNVTFAGKVANGQDFDGTQDASGDEINTGDIDATSQLTISGWVNYDTLSTFDGIVAKRNGAFVAGDWSLRLDDGTGTCAVAGQCLQFVHQSAGQMKRTGTVELSTGAWIHIAMTMDNATNTLKFFVDGQLDVSYTDATNDLQDSATALVIGHDGSTSLTTYHDGGMDELRLSDTLRSEDWIEAEYRTMTDAINSFSSEQGQPGATTTQWSFYDNSTPADGTQITTALLSTSTAGARQSYMESSPTVVNPAAIAVGETGEWDFSLDPSGATASTTYYFRMILSDDTSSVFTYSVYPSITTAPSLDRLMLLGKFYTTQGRKMPFRL